MSEEAALPSVPTAATEEKPAEEPPVDLAKQNEQTVAQTNAINDAVKATQVGHFSSSADSETRWWLCAPRLQEYEEGCTAVAFTR